MKQTRNAGKVTGMTFSETDLLLLKIEAYRSGYTCGYSDCSNGWRSRDKDAAALFYNIGVPDIAEPDQAIVSVPAQTGHSFNCNCGDCCVNRTRHD